MGQQAPCPCYCPPAVDEAHRSSSSTSKVRVGDDTEFEEVIGELRDPEMEGEDAVGGALYDGGITSSPAGCTATTMTRVQVIRRMRNAVAEVVELLGVDDNDAMLLLRYYGWSKDDLSEAYFADVETTRQKAGLYLSADVAAKPKSTSGGGESLCGICFTGAPVRVLPCGHELYCEDCWKQYVRTAVQESSACLSLRCPAEKCGVVLRPCDFRRFCVDNSELTKRYEKFELDSYVATCGTFVWCPGPRCGRAAAISRHQPSSSTQMRCDHCGTSWCAICHADAHLPVKCTVVKEWAKRRNDGISTWIAANTKPCPKCQKPIEKNGGCMHMTCSKAAQGCGHEFCWLCLGDWKIHGRSTGGYFQCNRFDDKVASKNKQAEHQRYAHFLDRFQEHEKAQHFASTSHRDQVAMLSTEMQQVVGMSVKQVEFLDAGVTQVVAGRCFLKWTYAHAFIKDLHDKDRELFEFHQAQLEGTLERLCDIMENTPWEAYINGKRLDTLERCRAQVISLTDVVRRHFLSLADGLERSEET